MSLKLTGVALRTSVVYWLVAALYIILSDRAVEWLVADPEAVGLVQTFKGWAFVTITALLLYVGLRGQLHRWEREAADRRRAEDALRTRMSQVQAIIAHLPVAIYAFDTNGVFTVWEGKKWPDADFPPTPLIGQNVLELARANPEAVAAAKRAMAGEKVTLEYPVGGRTFEISHTPLHDSEGGIVGTTGVVLDVTERKRLEAQLLRAQRLESVGRLAGGIAHDLNNMLSPVLIGAGVLRQSVSDPEMLSLVEAMESSARRGAQVIKQLLTFGRGVEGDRGPVHLKALVTEVRNIIRETFPKNIIVEWNPPGDGGLVQGDATQLHQVLLNLCVNARDAMPDGGTLELALETRSLDADAARSFPGARAGRYVVLCVSDTGTGIAPEHLDRIFDPFFTTKAPGVGTGLGLSTALGIVRSHGGFIDVQSRLGDGTVFEVYLPAGTPEPDAGAEAATGELPRGGGECVLVVDDEESVRRIVRRVLEFTGYRVVEAGNGTDALALYGRHRADVKVVLTDLMMPGMDGARLVRALHDIAPKIPIVTMTGIDIPPAVDELRQLGVTECIAKPFSTEALARAIQRALRSTS